jgi:ABC-type Zn uptake system ZnuABC Zn-binding protein ZnuA
MLVLPPGKSEHGYDPTPQEMAALHGAKLGIAVGLEMDTWVESIMKSAKSASVFRIGEQLPTIPIDVEPIGEDEAHHDHEKKPEEKKEEPAKKDDHDHDHDDHGHGKKSGSGSGSMTAAGSAGSAGSGSAHDEHGEDDHDDHGHEHSKGAPDPHVWLDPTIMIKGVDLIAEQLAVIDPAGKDTFMKNAAEVKAALQKVDGEIEARTKAFTKRTIVTFHGSMAYFAKRYNIRIAAVVEPLAGKEPTASYIAEVLQAIKVSGAVALFSEPQLDKGPGEMIAKEAGIKLGELDPVGGLKGREAYEALLLWNTEQLEKVLK